jgi:hypothetical protein
MNFFARRNKIGRISLAGAFIILLFATIVSAFIGVGSLTLIFGGLLLIIIPVALFYYGSRWYMGGQPVLGVIAFLLGFVFVWLLFIGLLVVFVGLFGAVGGV